MPEPLRNAIVALAVDEVKPDDGQAALHRLAVKYARGCPPTIGLEAALASLNNRTGARPAAFSSVTVTAAAPRSVSGSRISASSPFWQG
ncbi:MAG: hypothetical protein U0984_13515 [Prosthecobacter sp.]|nr:hypothetical protein [Prosthecobacter sp.]